MRGHLAILRPGSLPLLVLIHTLGVFPGTATGQDASLEQTFTLYPIGKVLRNAERTFLELEEQYEPGLLGLDELSHVTVVYWLDRNDTPERRAVLQVHPRGNPANPLRGVFATRSPLRPNLIAISRCRVLSVEGNLVEVDRIDAFDGSPLLDLKK